MRLETKTGKLTSYAFACGYIERRGPFTLFREHGCYHIKGIKNDKVEWLTARTLTEARKLLRTIGDN